jgi:hypothetical protein
MFVLEVIWGSKANDVLDGLIDWQFWWLAIVVGTVSTSTCIGWVHPYIICGCSMTWIYYVFLLYLKASLWNNNYCNIVDTYYMWVVKHLKLWKLASLFFCFLLYDKQIFKLVTRLGKYSQRVLLELRSELLFLWKQINMMWFWPSSMETKIFLVFCVWNPWFLF